MLSINNCIEVSATPEVKHCTAESAAKSSNSLIWRLRSALVHGPPVLIVPERASPHRLAKRLKRWLGSEERLLSGGRLYSLPLSATNSGPSEPPPEGVRGSSGHLIVTCVLQCSEVSRCKFNCLDCPVEEPEECCQFPQGGRFLSE